MQQLTFCLKLGHVIPGDTSEATPLSEDLQISLPLPEALWVFFYLEVSIKYSLKVYAALCLRML